LNGVPDHLLGFFVRLAFDARIEVDVDHPRADRLEVRLLLIRAPQAIGAAQPLVRRVVLMQPLRGVHHIGAMALEPIRGELPGLLIELLLLELHRYPHLLDAALLPVNLADEDDDEDQENRGDEA